MGENIPVSWRKHTPLMLVVYVLLCVFSGGIVYVMCVISPLLKAYLLTSPCNPIDSDTVLIYQDKWISVIPEHHNCISGWIIAIQIGSVRLWASHDTDWRVTSISDVPRHFSSYIHTDIKNKHNQSLSRDVIKAQYGLNTMHLPPVCYWDILTATLLHPFYLFQYFAVAVWIAEDYIEYSAVILLITGGAVYLTTNETMINLKRLHELAGEKHTVQFISPSGELVDVSNEELLPGDRIVVTEGDMVPCDAVLLSGRVSVDESMLTGESVPVNKTPLDVDTVFVTSKTSDDEVEINRRPNHILFCGTKVVFATQGEAGDTISAGKCMAVVYRTGFRSAKGQLVASLLNPRDKFLTFFSDTLWVILLMVIVSTGLYVWSAVYLKKHGVAWSEISLYYMDTLTFAIPPAMTACLTVATGISIERLTNSNVFVSESNRVNWAGIVTTCSFDKTGTLTEDKLHFKGMSLPSHLLSSNGLNVSVEVRPADGLDNPFPLLCIELMGTCHGLALINNVPVGDVLELELLRASGFMLSPYLGSDTLYVTKTDAMTGAIRRYEILKHFEFSSDKMKSSSLVRRPDGSIIYFTKGSPEAVAKFVKPSSLPLDMADTLAQLSRSGLRVLAFAYRLITSNSELSILMEATQAQWEKDSEYLGLVFLSNALKQDTISTINTLRQADIHCNMITGDHIYTAIAIAQDCSLLRESNVHVIDTIGGTIAINHYPTGHLIEEDLCEFLLRVQEDRNLQIAVTGNALEVVKTEFPRSLSAFVRRTQVFARMKPADKQYIVEQLQASQDNCMNGDVDNDMETGLLEKKTYICPGENFSSGINHVLFCGDGANDMAALRAAVVGVSLCEVETSVAAPVTSRLQTPGAVVDIIKEGRCSLITAYVLVLFNIYYAIIGLFSLIMMYYYALKMGDYTYLVQDLFFSLVLGLAISYTPPHPSLEKQLPPERFFTAYFVFTLISQVICFCGFQVVALKALSRHEWYHRFTLGDREPVTHAFSYESSVIADMGLAQIMIASVTATIDRPFRMPWYSNRLHVAAFVLQGCYLIYQIFGRDDFLRDDLDIKSLPISFGYELVGIIAMNWIVCLVMSRVGTTLLM